MKFSDKVIFKNGYEENNFVGLKYEKGKVIIFLPIGYNAQIFNTDKELSSEQKVDLLLLLKTVTLAKNINDEKTNFGKNIGNNYEIPYNSFIWIINDYFNNGLIQDIETKYFQRSHGKINWKKTINSEHYFEENGIIFINPYYNASVPTNTLITELNIYCIETSFKYIGFLFGKTFIQKSNLTEEFIKNNKKYCLDVINKELTKSFNDRKKLLLINMKRILMLNSDGILDVHRAYGTHRFEYAWEKMVNNTLGSKIDISKFFPNAYWNIQGKIEEDKAKLRPDSILLDVRSNKLYILDAKYYKYGITGNISDLPHTNSIQKQITYGEHISNNPQMYGIKKNDIYNAFILPFNRQKEPFKCDDNIKYMGFANSAWRNKQDNYNYEKISLLLVDTKYLIDCFYQKQKINLKKLIELIEKSSK